MDVKEAPKGKGEARQLVDGTGDQQCALCVSHNMGCWMDSVAVRKWKEAMACGVQ